ncbi:Phosphatidylglycerophosphate synthase [Clostridium cavendishii DSM 21758]|uniref:Phosphatidylglycerophosphate synthase n=1 Tax=Clostridium cavendishii DSM 21758 TaxID=1121302 RepID=A0A1M6AX89_9CLOT|nr:Phosphatidylglycerophosphate synthase [Clostridium cavendishii DSM 21758]
MEHGSSIKRKDQTMYIVERFYRETIISRLIKPVSKTFITPNMITIFNCILGFFIFYMGYKNMFIEVAIAFQIYELLDHLDGNLARYKNMSSEFGAKLDRISDFVFYTLVFVFIGFNNVEWYLILMVIMLINLYGFIAKSYIVPRLRKLNVIKRGKIKRWFLDKGYIIGMDLTLLGVITSFFLILGEIHILYYVIIAGYIIDIIYRVIELKINEGLKENKG